MTSDTFLAGVNQLSRRVLRKTRRTWTSFRRINFIRPYWDSAEFLEGILYEEKSDVFLENLADKFRRRFNISGVTIPTSSGRTALELALKVLTSKYPAKRKVIIPTYCCRGVFDPVVRAGLIPIFADIDENLNLSKDSVRKCDEGSTLAVVVPHIGGCEAEIEEIALVARQRSIVVIEDACQSLGRKSSNHYDGSQYDMAIFSFGLGKNLMGTAGGFLSSKILETDICEEAKNLEREKTSMVRKRFREIVLKYSLNLNGNVDRYILSSYGYNRMHPLDAGLVLSQLDKLDTILQKRRRNAKIVTNSIRLSALDIRLQEDTDHVYTKLPLIFGDAKTCKTLSNALQQEGVETESMYIPLHLREFGTVYNTGDPLPNAERAYKNVFNVPVRPNLGEGELKRIVRAIENAGKR